MNWGIRIAAILVILAGIAWLSWDQSVEESKQGITLDKGSDQTEDSGIRPVEESKRVQYPESVQSLNDSEENSFEAASDEAGNDDAGIDEEVTSSKLPEFDLQPAPGSLDNSDRQVLSVVKEISPEAVEWFQTEEQLRKLTLLVTLAAEGKTLYQDRPFRFNLSSFAVEEHDDRYFISPKNFERYDRIVSVLSNIPEDKFVAYYRSWYPLLEMAFGELGLPGSFDEQVDSMLERILAVEILELPIELKKPSSVTYKFLDPKLEKSSQIDKWLWRMGPENTRKMQSLASRLKLALAKSHGT